MANLKLNSGGEFVFKRRDGVTFIDKSSTNIHTQSIFNHSVLISGSNHTVGGKGSLQVDSKATPLTLNMNLAGNTTPILKMNNPNTSTGADTYIQFENEGDDNEVWSMGIDGTDGDFKLADNTHLGSATHYCWTAERSTRNFTIHYDCTVGDDLTVTDDLFVNDCAHIDALHVGTAGDNDPGDGRAAIDTKIEISENQSNANRPGATGNSTPIEIYGADDGSSGYSAASNGQNAMWFRWSSADDAYCLMGYDIQQKKWRLLLYDGSNWECMNVDESGNVVANGSFTTSDARLKENVKTLEGALDIVKRLRGVTFNWNDQAGMKNAPSAGVIAQEVEKVIPEGIIKTDTETRTFDEDGNLEQGCPSVDNKKTAAYGALTGYLIEAIKDQSAIVDKLTERIAVLEKKLENK